MSKPSTTGPSDSLDRDIHGGQTPVLLLTQSKRRTIGSLLREEVP